MNTLQYECAFDFTICKPNKSQFIGKSGVLEFTINKQIDESEIDKLKTDRELKSIIVHHLNTTLKQKNVFMVEIKTIRPLTPNSNNITY